MKLVSLRSRATTAKKCTKKRDARAKLLFCYLNLLFCCRSRCLSFLLLWSKNFATMVTYRQTSLYYTSLFAMELNFSREITGKCRKYSFMINSYVSPLEEIHQATCRFNRIIHFSTNLLSYGLYCKGVTALSRKKKTVNKRKKNTQEQPSIHMVTLIWR